MTVQAVQKEIENVVIRFAGDSGDGMQLTGTQFTNTSALFGNSLATLPDFPAEIRAPQGTVAGVSGFQVKLGQTPVYTPGDDPDVLVAMNPAALKANIGTLPKGCTILVNTDAFTDGNITKAGYESNPLEDNSLEGYHIVKLALTTLTREALKDTNLDTKAKDRSKNLFALGVMYWMYTRPLETTENWLNAKFAKKPEIAEANILALRGGYACGEATETIATFVIKPAEIKPGTYKNISGNEALALGLLAGGEKSGRKIVLGSYPITPATDILHYLAGYKNFDVITFQAEDEIAAVCSAIGASFGGSLAVTSTSGPGLNLKAEALGLAVKTELPLVVIDVQRAGPSTGLPTKTEQSDLNCAMFGRNGDSPICVLAPSSPSDCFDMAYEAVRIALKYMTPVILLSDGYIANGAEPWNLPQVSELPEITNNLITEDETEGFAPYKRDANGVRQWAIPGVKGGEHRLTGLETDENGKISYVPENHHNMVMARQAKIDSIAQDIPALTVEGEGDILLLGWGSTHGVIKASAEKLRAEGKKVAQAHLNYISPFPANIEEVLRSYKTVILPENNNGQLASILRGKYLIDIKQLNIINGQPFKVRDIVEFVNNNS